MVHEYKCLCRTKDIGGAPGDFSAADLSMNEWNVDDPYHLSTALGEGMLRSSEEPFAQEGDTACREAFLTWSKEDSLQPSQADKSSGSPPLSAVRDRPAPELIVKDTFKHHSPLIRMIRVTNCPDAIDVSIPKRPSRSNIFDSPFYQASKKSFKYRKLDSPHSSAPAEEADLTEADFPPIPDVPGTDPIHWIASVFKSYTTQSFAQVELEPRIREGESKGSYLLDIGLVSTPSQDQNHLKRCIWQAYNRNVVTTGGQSDEDMLREVKKSREDAAEIFSIEKVTIVVTDRSGRVPPHSFECKGPFDGWKTIKMPQTGPSWEFQLCLRLSGGGEPTPFHVKSDLFTASKH